MAASSILGSPYFEDEVGHYVGQYVDDGSPVVGEVFDVHLVVATLGNDCAGTRPKLEIALPPGVRPAVGGQHTIRCWLRSASSQPFGPVTVQEGCPTTLGPGTTYHPSISNWLSLDPAPGTPAAPAWPLPQGSAIEIQVPVVADRVLNGIGDTTGCVCAVASVQTINGLSRPDDAFTWSAGAPQVGAYVHLFAFAAPPSSPAPATSPVVGAGPAGPGPGGAGAGAGPIGSIGAVPAPLVRLPRAASLASLRAGKLRARVSGLLPGDRVRVRIRRGRRTLAQRAATARGPNLTVSLRPARSRAARRQLRRRGTVTATTTVQRGGRTVATLKTKLRLR